MSNNMQHFNDNTPRVYAASLAAYVSGHLHGAWIRADQDVDALQAEINAMLAASPEPGAEEWAWHDFANFGSANLGEYASLQTVTELAKLIVEHGPLAAEAYSCASDVDSARRMVEEQYQGAHDSVEAWAESFLEDSGQLAQIPENLRHYFDFEAFARDAELGGDIIVIALGGQAHVFWAQ